MENCRTGVKKAQEMSVTRQFALEPKENVPHIGRFQKKSHDKDIRFFLPFCFYD